MRKLFIAIFAIVMILTVTVSAETQDAETEYAPETEYVEMVEASESESETPPAPAETPPTDILTEDEADTEVNEETSIREDFEGLFNRLWEYVETNKTETLGVVGDVLILILAFVLKSVISKSGNATKLDLGKMREKVEKTFTNQENVVGVINNMIDGYNELSAEYKSLKESYDSYGKLEDERNRIVGALVAQNTALLEILTTVYSNSKNLPQGVKDIVNLKYANCLKMIEDDEKLIGIVEAVRETITIPEAEVESTTEE